MSRSSAIRSRRWSRVEYDRLIEKGLFETGKRLELISGALIVREPQGSAHATAIELAQDALRAAFGPGWRVRGQLPIALDDESEPDLGVVPGTPRDYRQAHPCRPVLIVEVAETSLSFDRRHKGSVYARASVADYWIVNLDLHGPHWDGWSNKLSGYLSKVVPGIRTFRGRMPSIRATGSSTATTPSTMTSSGRSRPGR